MTNKPQHTSGPWWRDDDGFIAAGAGETYVTIADFDCSLDIDIDEREANKSLAIASPDMLAALEILIEKADDILAAIDGTTDQFEPEAAALSEAASMAEKIALAARGQS